MSLSLSCPVACSSPLISLIDALDDVRNEETHLRDAGLLQFSSILVARSSTIHSSATHSTTPMSLIPPSVAPLATHGKSVDLRCDHCDRDGHVEAFCYRKRKAQKAQARRSSLGLVVLILKDLRGVLLL
jgi:hypothetical protein